MEALDDLHAHPQWAFKMLVDSLKLTEDANFEKIGATKRPGTGWLCGTAGQPQRQ